MVAAHVSPKRAPPQLVREFLASLTTYVTTFDQPSRAQENLDYIKTTFGYKEEDIRKWLQSVAYPSDIGLVDLGLVVKTLEYVHDVCK